MDPAPKLPSLPDVPLRTIVSHLPVHELIITFPMVHPRFTPFCTSVLRSNRHLKLHLGDAKLIERLKDWCACALSLPFAGHLLDSSTGALLYPNTYPSDFYRLRLDTLDSDNVEKLSSLMPAIGHLEVILDQVDLSDLSHLTSLLTLWAPTLRTLKLVLGECFHLKGDPYQEAPCQLPSYRLLLRTLNQTLLSLETLSLAFPGDTFPKICFVNPNEDDFRLSVLGRLGEFNFYSGGTAHTGAYILDALTRYASEKLTRIGLPDSFKSLSLPALTRHRLASRLTQIPITTSSPAVICRTFPSLTVSHVELRNLTSEELTASFQALASLLHLEFLTLSSFELALPHLTNNYAQMSPLKSLKVLIMTVDSKDRDSKAGHDALEGPFWASLFPAVQILMLHHQGRFCGLCFPGNYPQMKPCLAQLLAPFKVLPSLRKIFYQHARRTECTAEFTLEGAFVRTHQSKGREFKLPM